MVGYNGCLLMQLLGALGVYLASAASDARRHRRVLPGTRYQYYERDEFGVFSVKQCPYALGQQMIFDEKTLKCVPENKGTRIKRQTVTTGYPCFESIDCSNQGMYCDSTKRCSCLTTFVDISGICYQKINPGQGGCQNNRQCNSVWPGASCVTTGGSASGTCQCANAQTPFYTKDGPVCVNYGTCPLGGDRMKFVTPTTGVVATCSYGPFIYYSGGGNGDCPLTYDCICSTQNSYCDNPGLAGAPNTFYTFCCPSQALTCNMQSDSGATATGGGGTVTRYFYNQITGNCETFQYYGAGGNSNNFETQEFCESYCKLACPRGPPQYDTTYAQLPGQGPNPTGYSPLTCSSSATSTCDTSAFQCLTIGTTQMCCALPSYICSNTVTTYGYGGAYYWTQAGTLYPSPATLTTPTTYDPGYARSPSQTTTYPRFYFDSNQKKCIQFNFKGQGGNFNNFFTQDQCNQYCAQTLCTAGMPLFDSTGINVLLCTSTSSCPSTYTCTNSVCCPTTQTVCTQAKSVGTCGNYVDRWWYNAATGNCELFTFSGCQPNANNFNSYLACSTFCQGVVAQPQCIQGKALKDSSGNFVVCGGTQVTTTCPANYICFFDGNVYGCCPSQAYTCSLNYDQGSSCGPQVTRWALNSATRTCQTFTYYGCDGNSNNFATQQDCNDYCGIGGCPDGGSPFQETGGAYRICGGATSCPYTHYCTQVTLGTNTQYNYCCPTRTYVCGLPRDQGQRCSAVTLTRYFFNPATKNCQAFTYNGCGGNRNNFAAAIQCLNYCNSAGCSPGTIALSDPSTNILSQCAVGQASSCPSGYTCTYSTLLGQNVCCGAPGSGGLCPVGQTTYVNALTIQPLQCTPNLIGNCPSSFICWFSITSNQYSCCGSSTTQCPQGGSVYINPATNAAQQCTPGVTGACPSGNLCQATSVSVNGIASTTGYCCGSTGICPSNGVPQLVNNLPVVCSSTGASTCQSPYSCQYSSSLNQYYCCIPGVTLAVPVCGSLSPYVVNGAPVVCSSGAQSTNCPAPYTCQLYATTNTFYCCQTGTAVTPVTTTGCPPGLTPLTSTVIPGQLQVCSPNTPGSCPTGYYCQFNTGSSTYICCGSGTPVIQPAVCSNGSPAVQPCVPGNPSSCPTLGTQCTSLATGTFCCPITATCPTGQPASQPCMGGVGCLPGLTCTTLAMGQYCCPTPIITCPGGAQAFLNPFTSQPQSCVPGSVACPSNYACQQTANGFYCCQSITAPTSDPYGCPQGNSYLYPGNQVPLQCQPSGGFSCPSGYSCLPSQRYAGGYQCCSGGSIGVTFPSGGLGFGGFVPPVVTPAPLGGVLRPGDIGCATDQQCMGSGEAFARCSNGQCVCSSNLLVYNGRCASQCPFPYINVRGICTISSARVHFEDDKRRLGTASSHQQDSVRTAPSRTTG